MMQGAGGQDVSGVRQSWRTREGRSGCYIDVGVGYAVTESRIQLGTQVVNEKRLEEGG